MSVYRLNRLFNPQSGRALDVAVDHGFFGERSFLTGIEDMEAVVRTLVAANPDAVQLSCSRIALGIRRRRRLRRKECPCPLLLRAAARDFRTSQRISDRAFGQVRVLRGASWNSPPERGEIARLASL